MRIEVRGVQFMNKGAELMLLAILQKVGRELPEASFVMAPSARDDYVRRASLGLHQKVWLERHGIQWGRLGWMIPGKLRQYYGLVLDGEIDVVLDASGFVYTDQWSLRNTTRMAAYVKAWKKRGTKVILLPQALGPFTSPAIRKAFSFIAEHADRVFPRDDVSYQHVIELAGRRETICQAPDFTNLISGVAPDEPDRFRGRFCLVPNCRMIDKAPQGESARYISFCAGCIQCLAESDCRPFVLIHEGMRDLQLARQIVRESGQEVEIVEEAETLRVKGIIGLCSGVISSRFHGLVNALSQGVPALATGWSHKYRMLFQEYGVPDSCLSVEIDPKTMKEQIRRLVDKDSRGEIIATIARAAAAQRQQAEAMWRTVFSVIRR